MIGHVTQPTEDKSFKPQLHTHQHLTTLLATHLLYASALAMADGRTRKKHNLKFRHIGYNVDPYGQSFFPKCISAWNGLAQEIAEANTLDLFKSKLAH